MGEPRQHCPKSGTRPQPSDACAGAVMERAKIIINKEKSSAQASSKGVTGGAVRKFRVVSNAPPPFAIPAWEES